MDSVIASTGAHVVPPPRPVYGPPRRMRKSYSDRSYPRSKTTPVAAHGPRPGPTPSKTVKDIEGLSLEQIKQLRGY